MSGTRPIVDSCSQILFSTLRVKSLTRLPNAIHEQRPIENADPFAGLHWYRPFGGNPPFWKLLF